MTDEERRWSRSISQLKSYWKCGESFRLGRLRRKDLPYRPAAWTLAGIAFHSAYESWEYGNRNDDFSDVFIDIFNDLVLEEKEKQPDLSLWQLPPRVKTVDSHVASLRKRFLEKDIPNYERRCREAEWELVTLDREVTVEDRDSTVTLYPGDLALELPFSIDMANIEIRGKIDSVKQWPNGEYTIEDVKTGSPDNHEHDPRQLMLYSIALEEVYGITATAGRYWFTKVDRGSDWFNLEKYSREDFEEEFFYLDELIQRNVFSPNPGKHCQLCDVRPYCKLKGWMDLDGLTED